MNGTSYFYDTTGCGDIVLYNGATYRWNGDNCPSLEAILEGLDYGDTLPYAQLSEGDVAAVMRVLAVMHDFVEPVLPLLQHVEHVVCS